MEMTNTGLRPWRREPRGVQGGDWDGLRGLLEKDWLDQPGLLGESQREPASQTDRICASLSVSVSVHVPASGEENEEKQ